MYTQVLMFVNVSPAKSHLQVTYLHPYLVCTPPFLPLPVSACIHAFLSHTHTHALKQEEEEEVEVEVEEKEEAMNPIKLNEL
jgi:hypothetical protein